MLAGCVVLLLLHASGSVAPCMSTPMASSPFHGPSAWCRRPRATVRPSSPSLPRRCMMAGTWRVGAGTVLYLSLPGALASLWLLACLAYARARGRESGAVQRDLLAIVVIYTVRSAVVLDMTAPPGRWLLLLAHHRLPVLRASQLALADPRRRPIHEHMQPMYSLRSIHPRRHGRLTSLAGLCRQWASVAVSYSPRPLLSSPSRLYGAEVLSLGLNCLLCLSVAVLAVTTWARAAVGQEPADRLRARLTAAAWVVSAAATVAGAFILGRSGHALSNQVGGVQTTRGREGRAWWGRQGGREKPVEGPGLGQVQETS